MNKLFPLHAYPLGGDYNRQYHTFTWEPIAVEEFRMPAFQFERTDVGLVSVAQVIEGVENDITDYFRSGDELITEWTPTDVTVSLDGRNIDSYEPDNTPGGSSSCLSNNFSLTDGDVVSFQLTADYVGFDDDNYIDILLAKGLAAKSTIRMQKGGNELLYKVTASGADYNITLSSNSPGGEDPTESFTNGVVSCRTSIFDQHGNYITYNGDSLHGKLTNGVCTFTVQENERFYSDVCEVQDINGWLTTYTLVSGSATITSKDVVAAGSDAVIRSNTFTVVTGETVNFIIKTDYSGADFRSYTSAVLTNGTQSITLTESDSGDYVLYSGDSAFSGDAYIEMTFNTACYFLFSRIYKDYPYSHIKFSLTSDVDYADIYYKGGFTQTLSRQGNVRRSADPNVIIIGDERQGVLVKEKIITGTKYQVKIKCTEGLLDAFVTAISGTMTVTDQTGKTFTMYNMEVNKPDWHGTNGLLTVTFEDNINVFTQNATDL